MENNRTLSTPSLSLIWFAAAVSLAEILTGTFFAPLGMELGAAAIVAGHLIGCVLFALVSYISAATATGAMEAVGRSFGTLGARAFSAANVIQLVGWTAIMIMSGSVAATLLVPALGNVGWCIAIGALIVLWVAIGVKRMGQLQSAAALLLLVLTFAISAVVFGSGNEGAAVGEEGISFGAAVELAAAMPLSWLPVAGDYTREAKRPLGGTIGSTAAYFAGSCWMFLIGMGCALFFGSDDIAAVLAQAGFGIAGILVVVFSTVTTTFLDAQSAGVSAQVMHHKLDARVCGIVAAVAGTVLAAVAPVGNFEEFLYFIGSVFTPMATLLCVDYFVLHRDCSEKQLDIRNAVLWLCGFALYRLSLAWDIPCGNTLPVMAIIAIVAIGAHFALGRSGNRS